LAIRPSKPYGGANLDIALEKPLMMRRLLAAALAGSLAACSQPVDSEPSFKAPAVAEAPPQAPAVDANILTEQGWRGFRIGQSAIDAGMTNFAETPDATAECSISRPSGVQQGVMIMLEKGNIARITLATGSEIKAGNGIGVGDEEAQVRAAYPEGLVEEPHKYEAAPAKYLTLWTQDKVSGIRFVIGSEGKVDEIHAGGPAITLVEGCS